MSKKLPVAKQRECGECTVCCIYPEIPVLQKPAGERCRFLRTAEQGHGCSIYVNRPVACRKYVCSWIEGHGKERDRPDKCGVLVDLRETDNFGTVLVARSAVSGTNAIFTKAGKNAIKRIAKDAGIECLVTADDNNQRVVKRVK